MALVALGGALATGAGAQSGSDPNDPSGESSESSTTAEEYFVLQADGGTVVKNGNGKYLLTLEGVEPDAVVFTDRPERFAGAYPVSDIIRKWKKVGFDEVPPNAALSVVDGPGRGHTATFELTDPKRARKSVTFTATPLDDITVNGDVASPVRAVGANVGDSVPTRFGRAALFVDPAGPALLELCTASIINNSDARVVGVGILTQGPTNFPFGTLAANGGATRAGSAGVAECTINYRYVKTGGSGGAFTFTMTDVMTKKNTVTASSNVDVQPTTSRSSSHWDVTITFHD